MTITENMEIEKQHKNAKLGIVKISQTGTKCICRTLRNCNRITLDKQTEKSNIMIAKLGTARNGSSEIGTAVHSRMERANFKDAKEAPKVL